MKFPLTFFLCFVCSISAFAQKEFPVEETKNEINIGTFNAFYLSSYNDLGIGFKRHNKSGAFRIGLNFSINNSNSLDSKSNLNSGILFYNNTDLLFSPRIGYEFHEDYNKMQLFYGLDLKTVYRKYFREMIYQASGNDELSGYKEKSFGLNPFIGVKYRFNKRFSLSTETNIYILYSKTLNYSKSAVNNSEENFRQIGSRFQTRLNPLGVFTFNFHF
jgi:hypothetical protein